MDSGRPWAQRKQKTLLGACFLYIILVILTEKAMDRQRRSSGVDVAYSTYRLLPIQRVIQARLDGGLGNQMFIVASIIGTSHRHNGSWLPCIAPGAPIWDVFVLEGVGKCRRRTLFNPVILTETAYGKYDKRVEALPTDRDVVIKGYRQSWLYHEGAGDLVRRSFKFLPDIEASAVRLLNYKLSDYMKCDLKELENCLRSWILIGVHVRRGDMTKKRARDYGYTLAPANYFVNAMNYFRRKYVISNHSDSGITAAHTGRNQVRVKPVFIVASGDISWSRNNLRGDDIIFLSERSAPGVDLAILSHCKHSIISVGSFGWWSAWIADGLTVYYSDWPRSHSALYFTTNRAQYFPPHWVGIGGANDSISLVSPFSPQDRATVPSH